MNDEAARLTDFFSQDAPDDYVQAWAAELAKPACEGRQDDMGVLVIRLGSSYVAWPASACLTLLSPRSVHTVPHRHHPALKGVVALSGKVMPCLSLARVLHVDRQEKLEQQVILVGDEAAPIAMLVDAVVDYIRLNHTAVEALPDKMAESERYMSQGMVRWDGGRVPLLEVARVLDAFERCMQG